MTTKNVLANASIVWHKSAFDIDSFPWPLSEVSSWASMSLHWLWHAICRSTVNSSSLWDGVLISCTCSSGSLLHEDVLVSRCTLFTLQPSWNFLSQSRFVNMSMWSTRLHSLYTEAVRWITDRLALLFLVLIRTIRVDHRVHGNRVMHESMVGIDPMIGESRVPLYEHSAHCPTVMEKLLRCNPQYRSFASTSTNHGN